jgi:uncharacterized protein (TIGR03083 family)
MEISDHIAHLEREGLALVAAAYRHGLDAALPTCPGWTEAELVRHTGGIQRWATRTVAGALRGPIDEPLERIAGGWPPDTELLDWFRSGLGELVAALRAAPPSLACFTFLAAPSPLAFWARRQAQEVTMHRVDAESPGGACTPIDPDLAVDGVDEMLFAFAARPQRRKVPACAFALAATDADRAWYVRVEPRGVHPSYESCAVDATVRGSASDLYRFVWNRLDASAAELHVTGDPAALATWRKAVRIRWTD